ncbi:11969_t:CDS:2, partial [Funneliformis geosporum]
DFSEILKATDSKITGTKINNLKVLMEEEPKKVIQLIKKYEFDNLSDTGDKEGDKAKTQRKRQLAVAKGKKPTDTEKELTDDEIKEALYQEAVGDITVDTTKKYDANLNEIPVEIPSPNDENQGAKDIKTITEKMINDYREVLLEEIGDRLVAEVKEYNDWKAEYKKTNTFVVILIVVLIIAKLKRVVSSFVINKEGKLEAFSHLNQNTISERDLPSQWSSEMKIVVSNSPNKYLTKNQLLENSSVLVNPSSSKQDDGFHLLTKIAIGGGIFLVLAFFNNNNPIHWCNNCNGYSPELERCCKGCCKTLKTKNGILE